MSNMTAKVIMHQMLSAKDVREIVDWLHERHLEFYIESNNGLFLRVKTFVKWRVQS